MIVKIVLYQGNGGKLHMDLRSKPRHQRGEHEIEYDGPADPKIAAKLGSRSTAYFHAHMVEDRLVLDDEVDGQHW